MNQLLLQRHIMRQTLPKLMLFAAPNQTCLIQTDSNAALLPYLTHQLGWAHEWGGVWSGPNNSSNRLFTMLPERDATPGKPCVTVLKIVSTCNLRHVRACQSVYTLKFATYMYLSDKNSSISRKRLNRLHYTYQRRQL